MNIIIKKAVETVKTVFAALEIKSAEEFAKYFEKAFATEKALGKVTFVGKDVAYVKVWHTTNEETSDDGITTKTGVSMLLVCKGEYALTKDSKYYINLSNADVEISESAKNSGEFRAYIKGAKIS